MSYPARILIFIIFLVLAVGAWYAERWLNWKFFYEQKVGSYTTDQYVEDVRKLRQGILKDFETAIAVEPAKVNYDGSYADGVNTALDSFILLNLEQQLDGTRRPMGEMAEIVCKRLKVPRRNLAPIEDPLESK
jgi:hypothetical protein